MIKEYTNDELTRYLKASINCLAYAKGITGFVLNHNYKEIFEKIHDYLDLRNAVIKKYGEQQDDDGDYTITSDESLAKAEEELNSYANLKVSVDIIKIPEEKTIDSGLSGAQLMSLSWMIVDNSADDIRTILCIPDYDAEKAEEENASSYDPRDPMTDPRFV